MTSDDSRRLFKVMAYQGDVLVSTAPQTVGYDGDGFWMQPGPLSALVVEMDWR